MNNGSNHYTNNNRYNNYIYNNLITIPSSQPQFSNPIMSFKSLNAIKNKTVSTAHKNPAKRVNECVDLNNSTLRFKIAITAVNKPDEIASEVVDDV